MDGNLIEDSDGYLRRWIPDHPNNNNGYMLEHRLIMEKHICQYLKTDWVVHHINHNKHDNQVGNLFICTQNEHIAIHNRENGHSTQDKLILRKAQRAKNRKNKI